MGKENKKRYVIGVDGGGAKTMAALADLNGRILKLAKTGPSHPRNIGIKKALTNLALAIEKVLPIRPRSGRPKEILVSFLGLPAMEEEFKFKKEKIKKELLKHKKIFPIFKGKLIIGSDQLAGFRSGTEKKEGMVLIAGSGCVVHGWHGGKEAKIDGWGYLSELGSAFWVGQRALQEILKDLDGRGPKTLITKLVFRKLKIKNKENFIEKIYSKNPTEIIPPLSILVERASQKGDKVAQNILKSAGKELAFSANAVIKKLNFPRSRVSSLRGRQNEKFPLVLIGSMFKSKLILDTVKKEIKKFAPKAEFIQPEKEPVVGAIKLALSKFNGNTKSFF